MVAHRASTPVTISHCMFSAFISVSNASINALSSPSAIDSPPKPAKTDLSASGDGCGEGCGLGSGAGAGAGAGDGAVGVRRVARGSAAFGEGWRARC